MRQFEKKRRIKKFMYSKFVIILLLFILFILARGTFRIYQKSRESNTRENTSVVYLSGLQNRRDELEDEISYLESRVGIEEQLRTHYSFAKEGEKVIIIIDEKTEEIEYEEREGFMEKTKSWFRRINLLK